LNGNGGVGSHKHVNALHGEAGTGSSNGGGDGSISGADVEDGGGIGGQQLCDQLGQASGAAVFDELLVEGVEEGDGVVFRHARMVGDFFIRLHDG